MNQDKNILLRSNIYFLTDNLKKYNTFDKLQEKNLDYRILIFSFEIKRLRGEKGPEYQILI